MFRPLFLIFAVTGAIVLLLALVVGVGAFRLARSPTPGPVSVPAGIVTSGDTSAPSATTAPARRAEPANGGNEPAPAERKTITLLAADANLQGKHLRKRSDGRSLAGWRGGSDLARWAVTGDGGAYQIELVYAIAPGNKGEYRVYVDNPALDVLQCKTSTTGAWDRYERVRIGALRVPKQPSEFFVAGDELDDGDDLMHLRQVNLVPVSDEDAPAIGKFKLASLGLLEANAAVAEAARADAPPPRAPAPPPAAGRDLGVSGFTLVTRAGNPISPLGDGMVLNLAAADKAGVGVRAETLGEVRSVRFAVNDTRDYRTENMAPFVLDGDGNPWKPKPGSYSILATPFAKQGAAGEQGKLLAIRVRVVNGRADEPIVSVDAGEPRVIAARGKEALELRAAAAALKGGELRLEGDEEGDERYIGNWTSFDAQTEWTILTPVARQYRVELVYACDEKNADYALSIAGQEFRGAVKDTGDWENFQRVKAGALLVPAGRTVVVLRLHPPAGKMPRPQKFVNVRSIRLVPTDDDDD